jgi:hypothetical protein
MGVIEDGFNSSDAFSVKWPARSVAKARLPFKSRLMKRGYGATLFTVMTGPRPGHPRLALAS